jgi:sterol desaturase/sphingolipid hydroxylase (fatty acid hydroxylase superfamily)
VEINSDVYNDPTVWAIPVYLIVIAVELIIDAKEKLHLYEWKDSFACIAMGIGSLIIGIVVKTTAFFAFSFIYQYRLFEIGHEWWAYVILFFLEDFSFYWHHRLSHQVRILWAAHVNHHSSQKLNFAVALRQSWAELLYKYIFWMWLPLIGFEPLMIMFMMSLSLIYQFLQHTQIVKKLGPIEWFFNTPSHHRVHHASNIRYLDRNHAGILIIWDRLFETFEEESETEKPVFGITNNIETYNPVKIATHEFINLWNDVKRSPDFKTKLKYIFNPPGWSHNGPNRTSDYLRKQANK